MSTFIESLVNAVLMIVLPVGVYLLLIGGVIVIDSYYGVIVSKKQNRPFNLYYFLKMYGVKISRYTPAMIGVYWMDYKILNEIVLNFFNVDLFITRIICGVLMSTEIISINRNFKIIHGKSIGEMLLDVWKVGKKASDKIKEIK